MTRTSLRIPPLRAFVVVAGAAGLLLAGSASAASRATTLTVTDASADDVGAATPAADASHDISAVTFTTSGSTTIAKTRTKSVMTYTAKNLVVKLALAGAPKTDGTVAYGVQFALPSCPVVELRFAPGSQTPSWNSTDCNAEGATPDPEKASTFESVPAVNGSTITWTVPFSALPETKAGTTMSGLEAFTSPAAPVHAVASPSIFTNAAAYDGVTSEATYTIG